MNRALVLAALLCLAPTAGGAAQAAEAAPAAAPVPLKIGVLLSRTGVMADIGAEGEHGFELAIAELGNQIGGSRFRLQFIYEDSRSTPDGASTAINKLIHRDHVDLVLGDLTSTVTLAAAPIAQSAQVPLLTPSSTSDKVTAIGDYIFRACYVDSFQGLAMANYAYDALKARRAAVLVDTDVDHSQDVSRIFAAAFERRGGQVLETLSFSGSRDTSYLAQLTALRRLKADVIYAPVYYARMGVFFKQAKAFKLTSQFLGTDAWDSPQLFKLAAGGTAGALLTDPFSYLSPEPVVQDFRRSFLARYKVEPSSYAALAYDSVHLLADALRRLPASATAPWAKPLRASLAATSHVQGVTGDISLDAQRNVAKPNVVILKLTAEAYTYHTTYTPPR